MQDEDLIICSTTAGNERAAMKNVHIVNSY